MRREIDADFLANLFDRIAILLEIKGENPFKVNAYRRAAENLRRETRDIVELYKEGKLTEIPGVGKAIAQKITEILENGKLEFYYKLTAEIPERLLSLYEVPEMGPKRIKLVWEKLGIDSVEKPVSYTHLDVYKRQLQSRKDRVCRRFTKTAQGGLA